MNELVLVNSRLFNGVRFDCYQDAHQQDNSDFWATRTQIGGWLWEIADEILPEEKKLDDRKRNLDLHGAQIL